MDKGGARGHRSMLSLASIADFRGYYLTACKIRFQLLRSLMSV